MTEPSFGTFLVPVTCRQCGANKRNADGQLVYVQHQYAKGKRMVCPDCYEAEQTMQAMETVVLWDTDDLSDLSF